MPTVKVGWRSGTPPQVLDTYAGAAAAYSLRKIRNAYSGSAIRVRRSSDNAEQNIGFAANGGLDTATLLAFAGSGNAFVTTWFDQSGKANNVVQTTASGQPQIVSAGAVITLNSKPTMYFNGANSLGCTLSGVTLQGLTTSSLVVVGKTTVSSGSYQGGLINTWPDPGWGQIRCWINTGKVGYMFGTGQSNGYNETVAGYSSFIYSIWKNGANEILRVNSSDLLSYTNKLTSLASGNQFMIGYTLIGSPLFHTGNISEVVYYPTNYISSRSSIESEMNSYYSIFDADAEAFIAAVSGSGANAIRTLVPALKSAGLWAKCRAIYPFVGGTAARQRLNLKDPRDLNEAYRLTFAGGWSHWTEGPQSSWGTAQTYLNPTSVFGATSSASLGVYQAGGMGGSGHGAWSHSGTRRMAIFESGGGFIRSQITSAATEAVSPDMRGVTNGFLIANRSSSASNKIWRHGVVQGSNTATETALLPDANITLCNVNGNASSGYVNTILYFAYIAEGLTDAQVSAMHSAVQAFRISYGYYI